MCCLSWQGGKHYRCKLKPTCTGLRDHPQSIRPSCQALTADELRPSSSDAHQNPEKEKSEPNGGFIRQLGSGCIHFFLSNAHTSDLTGYCCSLDHRPFQKLSEPNVV